MNTTAAKANNPPIKVTTIKITAQIGNLLSS